MTLLEFGGSDSLACFVSQRKVLSSSSPLHTGSNRNVTVVPGGPRIIIATSLKDFCIAGMPSTCAACEGLCLPASRQNLQQHIASLYHPTLSCGGVPSKS
eukprot:764267-Hanusia_phi.AAC.3